MKFMIRYCLLPLMGLLLVPLHLSGQGTLSGLNYQMTMIDNPSVAGSEGNSMIRLSYFDIYPGNGYNLHSVFVSYDGYHPLLHGGAGFYLNDDYLGGIFNDLKGGFSYSYFFRATRDLYISSGLSASFYRRGFNPGNSVLPDQIDPLNGIIFPTAESLSSSGKTVFDLGTGFLFIMNRFFAGIAITHLTQPNLAESELAGNRLYRQVLIHGSGEFNLNREGNLKIRPLGKIEFSRVMMSAGAGAAIESNHLSFSSVLLADNEKNIDFQAGFSIKAGIMVLFYNYRFNIASGKSLLPCITVSQYRSVN